MDRLSVFSKVCVWSDKTILFDDLHGNCLHIGSARKYIPIHCCPDYAVITHSIHFIVNQPGCVRLVRLSAELDIGYGECPSQDRQNNFVIITRHNKDAGGAIGIDGNINGNACGVLAI